MADHISYDAASSMYRLAAEDIATTRHLQSRFAKEYEPLMKAMDTLIQRWGQHASTSDGAKALKQSTAASLSKIQTRVDALRTQYEPLLTEMYSRNCFTAPHEVEPIVGGIVSPQSLLTQALVLESPHFLPPASQLSSNHHPANHNSPGTNQGSFSHSRTKHSGHDLTTSYVVETITAGLSGGHRVELSLPPSYQSLVGAAYAANLSRAQALHPHSAKKGEIDHVINILRGHTNDALSLDTLQLREDYVRSLIVQRDVVEYLCSTGMYVTAAKVAHLYGMSHNQCNQFDCMMSPATVPLAGNTSMNTLWQKPAKTPVRVSSSPQTSASPIGPTTLAFARECSSMMQSSGISSSPLVADLALFSQPSFGAAKPPVPSTTPSRPSLSVLLGESPVIRPSVQQDPQSAAITQTIAVLSDSLTFLTRQRNTILNTWKCCKEQCQVELMKNDKNHAYSVSVGSLLSSLKETASEYLNTLHDTCLLSYNVRMVAERNAKLRCLGHVNSNDEEEEENNQLLHCDNNSSEENSDIDTYKEDNTLVYDDNIKIKEKVEKVLQSDINESRQARNFLIVLKYLNKKHQSASNKVQYALLSSVSNYDASIQSQKSVRVSTDNMRDGALTDGKAQTIMKTNNFNVDALVTPLDNALITISVLKTALVAGQKKLEPFLRRQLLDKHGDNDGISRSSVAMTDRPLAPRLVQRVAIATLHLNDVLVPYVIALPSTTVTSQDSKTTAAKWCNELNMDTLRLMRDENVCEEISQLLVDTTASNEDISYIGDRHKNDTTGANSLRELFGALLVSLIESGLQHRTALPSARYIAGVRDEVVRKLGTKKVDVKGITARGGTHQWSTQLLAQRFVEFEQQVLSVKHPSAVYCPYTGLCLTGGASASVTLLSDERTGEEYHNSRHHMALYHRKNVESKSLPMMVQKLDPWGTAPYESCEKPQHREWCTRAAWAANIESHHEPAAELSDPIALPNGTVLAMKLLPRLLVTDSDMIKAKRKGDAVEVAKLSLASTLEHADLSQSQSVDGTRTLVPTNSESNEISTKTPFVVCPRTGERFKLSEVRKIFFM